MRKTLVLRHSLLILLLSFHFSCTRHHAGKDKKTRNQADESAQNSDTTSILEKIEVVDINSLKASQVKYPDLIEPQPFHKIGQIDTLRISPELICASKSKHTLHNEEFDSWDGEFKIIYKGQEVFRIGKALGLGPFEFNKKNMLLSFPICYICDDAFQTSGDMVLVDLNSKKVKFIKKALLNTINGFFSSNGEYLFYLNDNNIYKYDLKTNKQSKVLQIDGNDDNSILPLYMNNIGDSKLELIYLKDTTENHVSLPAAPFKAEISLGQQVF